MRQAALELAGVEDPPSRTDEAKQQAVDHADLRRGCWAARTACDCRHGGQDLLGGVFGQ